MTRFTLCAAVLLGSATAAFAGPIDVPHAPPPVYVEPENCALAFDCFYAGIELGFGMGEGDEFEDILGANQVITPLDYDGGAYGVFAGYNFQNGNMIYGGELRYLHLNLNDDASGFEVNSTLDLRARLGFAASEQLMVYGAAGWSIADATAAADFDMDGFNYGVGAEYNVSESFFVGADLTGRQLEGTQGIFTYEGTVNTATIRAGFRF
jgi:opacity protein-like surface antigen